MEDPANVRTSSAKANHGLNHRLVRRSVCQSNQRPDAQGRSPRRREMRGEHLLLLDHRHVVPLMVKSEQGSPMGLNEMKERTSGH